MADDPKNPLSPQASLPPNLQEMIDRAVSAQVAPLREENEKLREQVENATRLANAKEGEVIAPVKVQLKEAEVRAVLEACPSRTGWYYIHRKPWKSKRHLGSFTPTILAPRVKHFENGNVEDVLKGLTCNFRPPNHQIGCDLDEFTVFHYDLSIHAANLTITAKQIAESQKHRAAWLRGEKLPPTALVLHPDVKPQDGKGFYPLGEGMEGMERLFEKFGQVNVEPGFSQLQREMVFFAWALKHYVGRWASLRLSQFAQRAAANPGEYDAKSGLGLLEAMDKELAGAA